MLIINIYQTSGNFHHTKETAWFDKEYLSLSIPVGFPVLRYNEMFTVKY